MQFTSSRSTSFSAISSQQAQDFVFISADVEQYEWLAAITYRKSNVIILDSEQDGVAQITDALNAAAQSIRRLHIISHGVPGSLQIGSNALSLKSLSRYANELIEWRSHLAQDAEILLYGCNIAHEATGEFFLHALHYLTGAAIAASTTPVGHISQGGNWILDYQIGTIQPYLAFPRSIVANYGHTLETAVGAALRADFRAGVRSTDVGFFSTPTFADIDGDGDQDRS
jgi:hypothetical protein